MSLAAIKIENLSYSIPGKTILDNVSLSLAANQFSVILGRNGSGKSTLFNLITGKYPYSSGVVELLGKERSSIPQKSLAKTIGFLPQFHQSVFPFSVYDVILTGRAAFYRFGPSGRDHEIVEQTLLNMGISHLKDKSYTDLSGGERQLVLISRVMAQGPDILVLDEPTNHLDLHFQVLVLDKLKLYSRSGHTVICIMHDPNMASIYADHTYFIKDQKAYDSSLLIAEDPFANIYEALYEMPLMQVQVKDKTIIIPQF
ncbi:ABC transporter ATP-binding protein [Pedobacter gandavensis]|uniref:ATP-binding cassette domain-containing protein n=1 Tax=Pedobacter gandavensis TaxID=2679963 RepID=A0ABR6ES66_9SPHI|nr:ABC transporter ATP-binding protein [Pedobacter gandavensis]MBB2148104.1 ATP-binding cassette domain-containing protein [Pedobacter gandavensis]